jgi:DNA-binding XRE family transcriptional regulator
MSNAIQVARKKRNWTQVELAQKLNVSQGTISFWENGEEIPSLIHQLELIDIMPEILTAMAIQELNLLNRVQALERRVFNGKCGCAGCGCSEDTPVTPISDAIPPK